MENDMNQGQPMQQDSAGPEQGWEANRGVALAARIPILFWLPLVTAKGSRLAMFHANQGLLQLIVSLVTWIPLIGWALGIVNFVFVILGMIDAYNGKMKPLPLIGGIKILK